MKARRSLTALAGAALLALASCSSDTDSVDESPVSRSSSSTTASTTPSLAEASSTSSEQASTGESTAEPLPAEPAEAQPAQPASPTATYMNPGEQYGEVCYSGTPDQWPRFVNPATGCGAVLNPNYVDTAAEPYIVECLVGTPGPTLMSDGTTQYTDYCHQQGTSHPGYVDEGTITEHFWSCMEAGGTAETCGQ